MKYRILYCQETISIGGVEQRRLLLGRHLDKNKYDIKIICTFEKDSIGDFMRKEGMEVFAIGPMKNPLDYQIHKKVFDKIKKYNPHIIHGAVFEGVSMATIGGFLGRVPIIIAEETSDPKNRSPKASLLLRMLTQVADKVIGISPSVVSYLKNTAKIQPHKIKLINNGVEPPRIVDLAELDNLRRKYGLRKEDVVVGSIGRLRNQVKLFSDIIKATALLSDPSEIKILIVGDGPDKELLIKTAKEIGLGSQLIMAGIQMDTAPFYQLMDIFCIVSDNEGFGLVAAEAMYHRLPVIATAVGGLKDIVVDGKTGFLVPSHSPECIAEKLQLLIDAPELRKKMGADGLARAENEFSAKVYVEKVHQLYQELLSEKGII